MRLRAWLFALAVTAPLSAVTLGQIDTFTDGTTVGWFVPGLSPNPPTNVPTGGPAGASDGFLELIATGSQAAGGRLSVLNETQWAGDYSAAGITVIRMDVNNFGPDDVHLRLLFEDFPGTPGPPINLALSSEAVIVPAGSGWTSIAFPITAADLIQGGFGTVAGALSDTDTLRIFHNPDPTFPGPMVGIPTVTVTLGIDNITADVPEPATTSMLTGGLLLLIAAGWRRQRQS